jgi:hypothetical protein
MLLLASGNRARTLDSVRARLGGRANSDPGVGQLVRAQLGGGIAIVGVVMFVSGDELRVLADNGGVRRCARSATAPLEGALPPELVRLAAEARGFAALREGEPIRFLGPGSEGGCEGILVEKCRFGGIVARDDGGLLGVGFRRIWPVVRGVVPS